MSAPRTGQRTRLPATGVQNGDVPRLPPLGRLRQGPEGLPGEQSAFHLPLELDIEAQLRKKEIRDTNVARKTDFVHEQRREEQVAAGVVQGDTPVQHGGCTEAK